MLPATRNRGPARASPVDSRARRPRRSSLSGNRARSAGTRSRSFSIATTRPARSTQRGGEPARPGADLQHRVVRRRRRARRRCGARSRGSVRKCWPRRRLARGTVRSAGPAACGRRSACDPKASASSSTAVHDRLGRLVRAWHRRGRAAAVSPNGSPASFRASTSPSVQSTSRSVPERPGHLPPLDAARRRRGPSGGAVASSRSGSPNRGTRNAYGWPALA